MWKNNNCSFERAKFFLLGVIKKRKRKKSKVKATGKDATGKKKFLLRRGLRLLIRSIIECIPEGTSIEQTNF